jgi:hypothetical protein
MRQKLSLFSLGIALFCGTASLHAQVKTDCDHSANFGSYKTYSWLKVRIGSVRMITSTSAMSLATDKAL